METPNNSTELVSSEIKPRFEVIDKTVSNEPAKPIETTEAKVEATAKTEVEATEQSPKNADKSERKYDNKYEQEIARMTRQKYKLKDEMERIRKENAELKAKQNAQFTQEHFASKEAFEKWQEQNKPVVEDEVDEDAEEALLSFQEQVNSRYKTPEELEEYNTLVNENRPLLNKIDADSQQYMLRSPVGADMLEFFLRQPEMMVKLLKTHKFDRPEVLRGLQAHFMGLKQPKQEQAQQPIVAEKKALGTIAGGKPSNIDSPKTPTELLNERRASRIK
jgi:uncharacterized protein YdcH (DUF465 family)